MIQPPSHSRPVNPLPWSVVVLFGAIVAVELFLSAAGSQVFRGFDGMGLQAAGWRVWTIEKLAFFDTLFHDLIARADWTSHHWLRMLTYPFVHGGLGHAAMASVFILAIGKFVGEVFAPLSMFALFIAATFAGALAYGLFLDDPLQLMGAYPPAYGFIGAFTYLMWTNLTRQGENRWRAFTLIGFLLAIQLVFGLLFGANRLWVADIAGFAAGFAVSPLLAPGGIGALTARLRG